MTTTDRITLVHPGEVLMEDSIKELGITQNKVVVAVGVPPRRINEIVLGRRAVTVDTAARLARYLGTTAELWLNLQARYDLDLVEDVHGEALARIRPLGHVA